MSDLKMGPVETRFAEIIWEKEPVGSMELVKLAEEALGWKKSTTYTVLKKLCDKGIFRNDGGTVTVVKTKQAVQAIQSHQFVEDAFSGSLPAFLAAFAQGGLLSPKDIRDIRAMIDAYEKGGGR